MSLNKIIRLCFYTILTIIFISGCSNQSENTRDSDLPSTIKAQEGTVQVKVEGPAVAEAYETIEIRSRVNAQILSMPLEGDHYAKDDIIIKLDESDLYDALRQSQLNKDQAQLDRNRAVENLNSAQGELKEKQALYKEGAISAEQLQVAEDNYKAAQYMKDTAEIKFRQNSLSYDKALKDLEAASIKAPFDGVVIKTTMNRGDFATSNSVILSYADVSKIRLLAEVDEYDISRVVPDLKVSITGDALGEESLSTKVERISPAAEIINNISIFKVSAVVDNKAGKLKPGMSADLSIMIQSDKGLVVPSKLIQSIRGRSYIKVWENNEEVTKRIEIGANDGTNTAVISGITTEDFLISPEAPSFALPGDSASSNSSGNSIVPISIPGTGSR